jgi:hypothetical protein
MVGEEVKISVAIWISKAAVAGPLARRRVDRLEAGVGVPEASLLKEYVDSIGSFSVVYVLL